MSVREEDLGSLKVLYITSNRIYNSYGERLHINRVHSHVHVKVLQGTTVCYLFKWRSTSKTVTHKIAMDGNTH